jgi:hypothetical protein
MRRHAIGLAWVLVVGVGCASGPFSRPGPGRLAVPSTVPRAEQVIAHLNQQSQGIQSVEFDRVSIQAKHGVQTFGVSGMLAYQKPRNFRLMASALNTTYADVGSNDHEFWFWFNEGDKLQYYCAHEELPQARGLAIPIHPDWVAEALCIQELDPADQYQVRVVQQRLELIGQAAGPQGQKLQRIISVALSGPNGGRIVGLQLRGADGADVWSADVTEYQSVGPHVLPRKITLRCPSQKLEMQFKLDGARVNSLVPTPQTFARPTNLPAVNLARVGGPPAAPQSLQRVRGQTD